MFDGVLWLEAPCVHGNVRMHSYEDRQAFPGCPGGTRRRVTVNYEKAREASRIDEGTDWPLEVLMEPEAFISIVVDAALEVQE